MACGLTDLYEVEDGLNRRFVNGESACRTEAHGGLM